MIINLDGSEIYRFEMTAIFSINFQIKILWNRPQGFYPSQQKHFCNLKIYHTQ